MAEPVCRTLQYLCDGVDIALLRCGLFVQRFHYRPGDGKLPRLTVLRFAIRYRLYHRATARRGLPASAALTHLAACLLLPCTYVLRCTNIVCVYCSTICCIMGTRRTFGCGEGRRMIYAFMQPSTLPAYLLCPSVVTILNHMPVTLRPYPFTFLYMTTYSLPYAAYTQLPQPYTMTPRLLPNFIPS